MTNFDTLRKNLEANGFDVTVFATKEEACDYLDAKLDGKTIGHGGSMTLVEMGLLDRLASHATVYRHAPGSSPAEAATAQVYLCSINGLAETGVHALADNSNARLLGQHLTGDGHDLLHGDSLDGLKRRLM